MFKRYPEKIAHFNRLLPLADFLVELVGDKKAVKILDVGSGPYPIAGQLLDGVDVDIHWCDQQDFQYFWDKWQAVPIFKIEQENMEKLSYADNSYDIVYTINALDHTRNAEQAVKEMIRVCKPGGWVYIDCHLIQHTNRGHNHHWDALEVGAFENEKGYFDLKEYGFDITFIDKGGERQFNQVIAKWQKPNV